MKTVTIYTLLIGCMVCLVLQPLGASTPVDSVYHRIVKEGVLHQSFYFGYPQGSATIYSHWGNNTYELDKLHTFVKVVMGDNAIYIKNIRLSGHSSVEGGEEMNERLSHARVEGFRSYLARKYPHLLNHQIELAWTGEDWNKLASLVDVSDIPAKAEIRRIIYEIDDADKRERKLMKLREGIPYKEMEKTLFPQLRRVEITVVYDVPRMLRDKANVSDKTLLDNVLKQVDRASTATTTTRTETRTATCTEIHTGYYADTLHFYPGHSSNRKHTKPLLAIKSNLLLWAGITAEARRAAFTPNLSIEYFFDRHWSAEFEGKYAYWHYSNDSKFWGISGYRLEGRYWITLPNFRHIAYIGVYGRVGDYDIRSVDGAPQQLFNGRNYTSDYWDAGLSVGFYLPITSFLGLEAGVRGGYMSSEKALYSEEPPYAYLNKYDSYRKIMVTDLVLSLVFRLNR